MRAHKVKLYVKALIDYYKYKYSFQNCLNHKMLETCFIYVYYHEKLKLIGVTIIRTKWLPFETAPVQNLDNINIPRLVSQIRNYNNSNIFKSSANQFSYKN
jgi:hypothetical protein